MNKNKKLVLLSSSLVGATLAAGALSASCQSATQEDVDSQAKKVHVEPVIGLVLKSDNLSVIHPNDFLVKGDLDKDKYSFVVTKAVLRADKSAVDVTVKVTAKDNDKLSKEVTSTVDVEKVDVEGNAKASLNAILATFTYPEASTTYLPSANQDKLVAGMVSHLSDEASALVSKVEVKSVAAKSNDQSVAVVSYVLWSQSLSTNRKVASDVKTAEVSGFVSPAVHNQEETARLNELASKVVVNYPNKAETQVGSAILENFSVELPADAQATAEIVSATVTKAGSKEEQVANSSYNVEYTLTSTNPKYAGAKVTVAAKVSGFKSLTGDQYDLYNMLEKVVAGLTFSPVKAENTKTPQEALKVYTDTQTYTDVFTLAPELPEGVTFEVVKLRDLSTHPDALLLDYTLTASKEVNGETVTVVFPSRIDIRGFAAPEKETPKPEEGNTETVTQSDLDKEIARIKAIIDGTDESNTPFVVQPRLKGNNAVYLKNKSLNKVDAASKVLPSVYVQEFNAEGKTGYEELKESVLDLTSKDLTAKSIVVKSVSLAPNNVEGNVVATITFGSSDKKLAEAIYEKSFTLSSFMNQTKADDIVARVKGIIVNYAVKENAAGDTSDNIKLEENGIDLTKVLPMSVWSDEALKAKYKKLIAPKNGFVNSYLANETQDVTGATVDDELTKQNANVASGCELKLHVEDVKKSQVEGIATVSNNVAVIVPGIYDTTEATLVSQDDATRTNNLTGFLSETELEALKQRWIITAQKFINTGIQSQLNFGYYVDENGNKVDKRQTTLYLDALKPDNYAKYAYNEVGYYFPKNFFITKDESEPTGSTDGTKNNLTKPEYFNYAMKLNVKSAVYTDIDKTDNSARVKITYNLVSPFHPDWVLDATNTYVVTGFVSVATAETERINALQKLLNASEENRKALVDFDYEPNKSTTTTAKATEKDKKDKFVNADKFVAKWAKGADLAAVIAKQPEEKKADYACLKDYDLNDAYLTFKSANDKDKSENYDEATSGKVGAVFTVVSQYGKNHQDELAGKETLPEIKADLEEVTIEGFKISDKAEKARLNNLKAQFAYNGNIDVSEYNADTLAVATEKVNTEKDEDTKLEYVESLQNLRNVLVSEAVNNKDSFAKIAGYELENATIVVEKVAVKADDENNRNVLVTFHFESTTNEGVKSDSKTYEFGGFKNKQDKENDERIAKLTEILNSVHYSYSGTEDNAPAKKTPSEILDSDELKQLIISSTTKKEAEDGKFTFEDVVVSKPDFSKDADQDKADLQNNLLQVTFRLADEEKPELKTELRTVTVEIATKSGETTSYTDASFLSEWDQELARMKDAAKAVKLESSFANLNAYLPEEVLSVKALREQFVKSVTVKDADKMDVVLDNDSWAWDNALGAASASFVLKPNDLKFAKYADQMTVTEYEVKKTVKENNKDKEVTEIKKQYTVEGFATTESYRKAYDVEYAHLNKEAAKSEVKGDANAELVIAYPGIDEKYTANQILSDENLWKPNTEGKYGFKIVTPAAPEDYELEVLAVQRGHKDTNVVVTFRLRSTKVGMEKADEVFTGVTSDKFTSNVQLVNTKSEQEYQKEKENNKYFDRLAVLGTKKDWNDDANLVTDSRKEIDYLGITRYNVSFKPIADSSKATPVLDELLDEDGFLTDEATLKLYKEGSDKPLTDEEKAKTLASEISKLSLEGTIAKSGSKYHVSQYEILKNFEVEYKDSNKGGTLYAKVKLALDENPSVESDWVLVKVKDFQLVADRELENENKLNEEAKKLGELERIAKVSNIQLTENGVKEFTVEKAKNEADWSSLFQLYIPKDGTKTSASVSPWSREQDGGRVLALNALENTSDKSKLDAELLVSASEVPSNTNGVDFGTDTLTDKYVNVKLISVDVNDTNPSNVSLLFKYSIQQLQKVESTNEAGEKTVSYEPIEELKVFSKTVMLNVATQDDQLATPAYLNELNEARATFSSPAVVKQENNIADVIKKHSEGDKTVLTSTSTNPKFVAQVEKLVEDPKFVGRLIVTYKMVPVAEEGYFSQKNPEFMKAESHVGYIDGFQYKNAEESKTNAITNETVAPESTDSDSSASGDQNGSGSTDNNQSGGSGSDNGSTSSNPDDQPASNGSVSNN